MGIITPTLVGTAAIISIIMFLAGLSAIVEGYEYGYLVPTILFLLPIGYLLGKIFGF